MDWSKAKNIIIVALVATNLFLLFTYMTKNQTTEKPANQQVILTVLEGKNIFVDMDIPKRIDKMAAITIAYSNENNSIIEENLKKTEYKLSTKAKEEDYRKMADKFLMDSKMPDDALIFDRIVIKEDDVKVVYKACYKEIPIEGSFTEVSFSNGKLEDITRQFFTPAPQSKKKLNIIAPEEALLMFMSEKTSEDIIRIKNMELVFWINDSDYDGDAFGESLVSDTAFPAWEITYNDGEIKYIDAYKK